MSLPPRHLSLTADAGALPAPSADERARSDALCERIREEIAAAGGAIGFARFMELALYAPALGYYSADTDKFGPAGDFTTAPELGDVLAHCLAHALAPVLTDLGTADLLEVGGGSGRLAADLLAQLARRAALPERYYILELSGALRARQAATLKARAPALAARVCWLERPPSAGFRGVVLANEALDAMPVERFVVRAPGVRRLGVAASATGFEWTELAPPPAMVERTAPLELPVGYISEINLAAAAWVRTVGEAMTAGLMLLIDYGFPRVEFYHPERARGTLMCHYRHRAHADPLVLLGLQDITAHIDFTAAAEAARDVGLDVLGYTSQAAFLVGSGLAERVARSDSADARAHLGLTRQINKLTSPAEMGELFKVLALGRGVGVPLPAFSVHDRRGRL